jgi:hypothetical protein
MNKRPKVENPPNKQNVKSRKLAQCGHPGLKPNEDLNEGGPEQSCLPTLEPVFFFRKQGCQMVLHFQAKNTKFWVNFGGFCNGSCWYITYMAIWYILRPFDIFYGHLIYFRSFCRKIYQNGHKVYHLLYFPHFGMLNQEKSGNPGRKPPKNLIGSPPPKYHEPLFCRLSLNIMT